MRLVAPAKHEMQMRRLIGFVLCALALAACGGPKAPLDSLSGASTAGATSTGSSAGSSTSSGGTSGEGASTSAGATSGSSSSTGGTSSGSTGGGTTGGCWTDGRGGAVERPCLTEGDCACPFACHTSVCVEKCATTADCTAVDRS